MGCAIISVVGGNVHAAYDAGYVWNWQSDLTGNDTNGTHVWYYQYGNVAFNLGDRTQNLQNLDQHVISGGGANDNWQINNSAVGNYPRIGKIDWNMALAPSEVKNEPNNSASHNVVLTWVSPVAGTLHIEGLVRDLSQSLDDGWDGVGWWLDKVSQGTASNLAQGYVEYKENGSYNDVNATDAINLDIAVNAGDSISFIVNAGWTQWGDNTAYDVTYTLTSVPEASSLAILAVGSGLLVSLKKRKQR